MGYPYIPQVEYCRANGISMVPKLIGQAPVPASAAGWNWHLFFA